MRCVFTTNTISRRLFGRSHRERLAHDPRTQLFAHLGLGDLEQRLRVAHAETTRFDVGLDGSAEVEEPDVIRDRRAVHRDLPADLLLGMTRTRERLIGERELDRIQILALHVLDDRELEAVGGIDVENHRRHAAPPRELTRAKSPLAHDELVAAPGLPNDDGL